MQVVSQNRIEKIARNINAMDIYYQYSDDAREWRFWNDLNNKLRKILKGLSPEVKEQIRQLCNEQEAKYFNLI
ncbi:hypothetical protein [Riemerella anatipestifer]|uniref:Uncharacterized protein n=1 Tax=Riemerella anatipestifer (strain ATCC 11845 / DSM 15868 / JCM 9532 / NCTC 11014) TaxID=693978 RepID=E4T8T4_RIEAD|nr:hypothetical protein [Riemerella anatipestifer]ADQ81348.1 hypothetical protein Riean_0173 [Riemerella anatipestifer ATCC 11845 = DSM 15868]ADZ13156.1 hypothetical protein RIA_2121 [Riemerella anatipestifer RA-GD]AFD55366.1 hypothetical protein RA0C_0381 [Riemerella anatipestifer ATCC 11845 = DSM 15868]MCO7316861.1 hypothetical protein [Riemerella anatipestifer]MCO7324783.1 hypothetical protein [Riemerella anatipestifer]